jgi:hypothetical protein
MSPGVAGLPPGQWATMSERQRRAWKNACALFELDRRARRDPTFLSLPPSRPTEPTQSRS